MKRILFTFILIITLVPFTQGQVLKNLECQSFKNGTFVTEGGIFDGRYAVKRRGNKQTEIDQNGSKFIFDVNWLSECSYSLKLRKIAKNPMNIKWQEGDSIVVEIEEVYTNGYEIKSTTTDGLTAHTKLVDLKRKDTKRYLTDMGFDPDLVDEEDEEEDDSKS